MFVSKTWSWLYLNIILMICSMLIDVSEAHQTALVGTVYCDTCFHQHFSKSSYFISGASVAVECGGHRVREIGGTPRFLKKVKTNKKGEFRVKLPFNEIKGCLVRLISSNDADCTVAASTTSSSIQLKMKTHEYHVFSAGFFMFQPLQQPKRCQMQSRNEYSNDEFISPTPLLSSPVNNHLYSDDLINNFGSRFIPNQFLLQPPPDSMFNLDPPQPPPDSIIHLDPPQPPPESMFNRDPQPPPASMLNPSLQLPPDSMFNLDPQPPPASMLNSSIQPPPDSMFDLDPHPPPTSVFDPMPLPTPPAPIFDTFPPSPLSSIPEPTPSPPSLPITPPDPQPDLIQSTPPPPPSMPPVALLPPFPPFPFQPRQGLPRMPPPTTISTIV